jgi:hypothetical protein
MDPDIYFLTAHMAILANDRPLKLSFIIFMPSTADSLPLSRAHQHSQVKAAETASAPLLEKGGEEFLEPRAADIFSCKQQLR